MTTASEPIILSADVVDAARCTYRQLDHWCRRGWLAAHQPAGDGHGHPRVWSLSELGVACRMAALVEVGFSPTAAARVARDGWDVEP